MKFILLITLLLLTFSAHAEKIVIKFYANWCGPCRRMTPIVKSVSDKLSLELQEIDIDSNTGHVLADKLNVEGIPTLVLIKNGNEVCRIVGFVEEKDLLEKVEDCFKDIVPPATSRNKIK